MKKTIYATLLFLAIGVATTACKKETGPKTVIENPMQKVVSEKIVVDSFRLFKNNNWEFGNKLFFSRNGKITKLGCMMGNKGNFRVSLWDFATQNLITATTISVTDTTKFTYNNISPVDITANTRYVISLNNTSNGDYKLYYVFVKKSNLSGPIFPFTNGSATYEDERETSSATSVFPAASSFNSYLPGVPDFQFEYTE